MNDLLQPLLDKIRSLPADKRNGCIREMTDVLRAEILPELKTCAVCGWQSEYMHTTYGVDLSNGKSFTQYSCGNRSGKHYSPEAIGRLIDEQSTP